MYDLDLARSVYVGDRSRDIAAGVRFGGATALVRSSTTTSEDVEWAGEARIPIVASLEEAVSLLLGTPE